MTILVVKVLNLVKVIWYLGCPGITQINNFLSINALLNNNLPLIDIADYIDNFSRKMAVGHTSFGYLDSLDLFNDFKNIEITKDKVTKDFTYSIKYILNSLGWK